MKFPIPLLCGCLVGTTIPCLGGDNTLFSESFTEESTASLVSTGFKPAKEDQWKGVGPEAVSDPDSPFAPSSGTECGALRISSGSLSLPGNHEKPPFASILLVALGGTTALFDEIRVAESWQDLGL